MNNTIINKSLEDKFINEIHEAYQKKKKNLNIRQTILWMN